ncbi:HTH domain-containing protein [Fulvivirga sp. 29W222]|uniref:HTH domain-containing protein n=1 Tax=Fulvivirga marina TaxID=2494733 RepID=A0A937FVT3_9BACT|nr:HTH domain-containing protein [Fulvivirga marina]MBL6445882.1 HTH domain-containing protein [Fulvivirga marina]
MKSVKIIEKIEQVDQLLQNGNVGQAKDFAEQLNVSRRTVFNLFKILKEDFDAPVVFDRRSKSYKYAVKGSMVMGFVKEEDI